MSQNGQTHLKNLAKMVRHTLKIMQQMLQDFKECLAILGHYALKG